MLEPLTVARRSVTIALGTALLASHLGGCGLVLSSYVPEPMPAAVTWRDSNSIEVAFPLCSGEAVTAISISGGDTDEGESPWILRQGDPEAVAESDEIVVLTIDALALEDGILSERWPIEDPLAAGSPTEVAAYRTFGITTTHFASGFYFDQIGSTGSWLIDGAPYHDSTPRQVATEEAIDTLEDFCASRSLGEG